MAASHPRSGNTTPSDAEAVTIRRHNLRTFSLLRGRDRVAAICLMI